MWRDLKLMAEKARARGIAPLFGEGRAQDFSAEADGLLLDYSKTAIDTDARAVELDIAGVARRAGRHRRIGRAFGAGAERQTGDDQQGLAKMSHL